MNGAFQSPADGLGVGAWAGRFPWRHVRFGLEERSLPLATVDLDLGLLAPIDLRQQTGEVGHPDRRVRSRRPRLDLAPGCDSDGRRSELRRARLAVRVRVIQYHFARPGDDFAAGISNDES